VERHDSGLRFHGLTTKGVSVMADSKSNRGGRDRGRVAGGQGYELGYFARKHGLSRDQARGLIDRIGNDRAKLNAAAERMKGR
jgi:hypothetical protein